MKFQITLILLSFCLLLSCKEHIPLTFASENFNEKSLNICKTSPCPEITITYVLVPNGQNYSENINSQINSILINALNTSSDSTPTSKTLEEAASQFAEIYQNEIAEFPDIAAKYVAEIDINQSYNSSEIISLKIRQYFYTGGAHGYEKMSYLNIDPETGNEIPRDLLFINIKDFTVFVEEKFRKIHNIAAGDAINSTGFWFEEDTFYLPETIGFTENDLILIYNQYDIASYADGPIQLEISLKEAAPFLKLN